MLVFIFSLCLEPQEQDIIKVPNGKHYLKVILKILKLEPKVKGHSQEREKSTFMSTNNFKQIRLNRLNRERKEDIKKNFKSQKASEYIKCRKTKKET